MFKIDNVKKSKNIFTVAFLHLAPREGDIEYNNKSVLSAIKVATSAGVKIIVTPELATSGYTFAKSIGTDWIQSQPDKWMKVILRFAAKKKLHIIIGTPERDKESGMLYNSALIISPDGKLEDFHRKLRIHPGLSFESWASPNEKIEPVEILGHKVGVLVCSDVWDAENIKPLKDSGVELLVLPTNWPPDPCGPEDCWERASKKYSFPVWVCNRTGIEEGMDFRKSESVVIVNGERILAHASPEPSVLLFDWDMTAMKPLSQVFKVLKLARYSNEI